MTYREIDPQSPRLREYLALYGAALTRKQRDALTVYSISLSQIEAAATLGIARSSLRSRMSAGCRRLETAAKADR